MPKFPSPHIPPSKKQLGEPVSLPKLLELVEQAARGDQQVSQQLFSAFMQMRLRPNTPPNERALADILIRVLIGERNPDLSGLDPEDVNPVSRLLTRLQKDPRE